jgi:hypothetical protein
MKERHQMMMGFGDVACRGTLLSITEVAQQGFHGRQIIAGYKKIHVAHRSQMKLRVIFVRHRDAFEQRDLPDAPVGGIDDLTECVGMVAGDHPRR